MPLYELDQCQRKLRTRLKKLGNAKSVRIKHLGLDLAHVDVQMLKLFREFQAKEITVELLAITNSAEKLEPPITPTIKKWCGSVEYHVNDILKRLRSDLDEPLRRDRKKLQIQVRYYSRIPSIHGFSLEQGGEPVVAYVSFNRWTPGGGEIDWGHDRYREISGSATDASSRDFWDIFMTTFAHFWNASTTEEASKVAIGASARRPVRDDAYEYDTFLSYNSRHKDEVLELARLLREQNLNVWLDQWCLLAGEDIFDRLEDGLTSSRTALVLFGGGRVGPYQDQEIKALLRQRIKNRDLRVIPVLLSSYKGQHELPLFLRNLKYERLEPGSSAESIKRLVQAITCPLSSPARTLSNKAGTDPMTSD